MDIRYINPFIESVLDNLKVMAQIQAVKKDLSISKDAKTRAEISAIIGLSGEIVGSAVISLPKKLALNVASAMFMEELTEINDDVKDAIGELANIVVGTARNKLKDAGHDVTISTPTIIIGLGHEVSHPHAVPFLLIPFSTDDGEFSIKKKKKKEK